MIFDTVTSLNIETYAFKKILYLTQLRTNQSSFRQLTAVDYSKRCVGPLLPTYGKVLNYHIKLE